MPLSYQYHVVVFEPTQMYGFPTLLDALEVINLAIQEHKLCYCSLDYLNYEGRN